MNGATILLASLFLIIVNLSVFTEVESFLILPGGRRGRPGRSISNQDYRTKRVVVYPMDWPTHSYRPGRSVPDQDRAKRVVIGHPPRFGRSVPIYEVRATRHATAMDSIIAPPEKARLARGDYFYSP
ncbi:unnamed protein product [Meloidogyne enterolobii]|uniref:Uncharacterized protein n=1 Tax=Meloidogyne enterolobii TaxID=390850 RepID=A0ACB0ZAQ7_MELEN